MKYFVSGIGTDVGKSYATGWLALQMQKEGKNVITQKFIQTGNEGRSEDIELHRQLMGIDLQEVDRDFTTAPIIYSYPASPDLAAKIDDRPLDLSLADRATARLEGLYDIVLIEGAGGLMVPLMGSYLTIDYVAERGLDLIFVTNGKLGSVSDTLLAFYAIEHYDIPLKKVIYNPFFDLDPTIAADTRRYLQQVVQSRFPGAEWLECRF